MKSDRDIILNVLGSIEARTRWNRVRRDLSSGLTLVLVLPLLFKLLDLAFPFRGATVLVGLLLWLLGSIIFLVRRLRGRGNLADAAASLDRTATLHDQMKTACWFIQNPRESEWVDTQIRHAARAAQRVDVHRLYPKAIPKTSLVASALLLLLVMLNFLPPGSSHNWFYLQAAPPFSLTAAEQKLADEARELLKTAGKAEESALAVRIEKTIRALEAKRLSVPEALEELKGIREELQAGATGQTRLTRALEGLAHDLAQNEKLQAIARALAESNIPEAVRQLRRFSEGLGLEPVAREVQDQLREASENSAPGLEEFARNLREAADSQDTASAQAALERASDALQSLGEQLQQQDMRAEAGERLQALAQSLEQRTPANTGSEAGGPLNLGSTPIPTGGLGEGAGGDQPVSGNEASDTAAMDISRIAAGGSQPDVPLYAEPTTLEVELVKAGLTGQSDTAWESEKVEESSSKQRAELEYKRVASVLTPMPKDALTRDRMPSRYKALIKQYFQTVQ